MNREIDIHESIDIENKISKVLLGVTLKPDGVFCSKVVPWPGSVLSVEGSPGHVRPA